MSATMRGFDSYFTEVSAQKRFFYIVLVVYVASVAVVSVFEPVSMVCGVPLATPWLTVLIFWLLSVVDAIFLSGTH